MKFWRAVGSVDEILRERAAARPERVAFAHGRQGDVLTYAELLALSHEWQGRFLEAGLGPGHRVALLIKNPLAFAPLYLSLLGAGITILPVDPNCPGNRVAARLEDLSVDLLITDQEPSPALTSSWVWDLRQGTFDRRPPVPRPPGPAVLLLTSGTTGKPKIIPLEERQLLYVAGWIAAHHGLRPSDRGYSALPLFHINAQVVGLLSTLLSGASLVLDERFHRTGFWDLLDSWQVTWFNAVPAILAILAQSQSPPDRVTDRLRLVRTASAPLPVALLARFQASFGLSVLETYGMSETASQITANPLSPAARRPGSVGLPVGIEVRIMSSEGAECRTSEVGSVELRGPSVTQAYIVPGPQERRAEARHSDGWLVTGDLGHRDEDGFLYLVGRSDDMINRGGEKVHPREIEEVLAAHPRVAEAVVAGQADPILGHCPVAFVLAGEGVAPAVLAEELRQRCQALLTPAKRPDRLLVVDAIPKSPAGKVIRRELAADSDLTVRASLALGARAS